MRTTTMRRTTRGGNRWWSSALLLSLALLAAAMAQCSEGDAGGSAVAPTPTSAATVVLPGSVPTPATTSLLKVDLAYVDKKSAAYSRFRAWVDSAVDG
ncbi:MAG: hypothetical protein ACREO7_14480, partial [Pseudoxanthomonas sp.]